MAVIAGREIPGKIFKINVQIAITAPVFPAETKASAKLSFTSLAPI